MEIKPELKDAALDVQAKLLNELLTENKALKDGIKKSIEELYLEAENIDRKEYTTEKQNATADGVLFALGMAVGIIEKNCISK